MGDQGSVAEVHQGDGVLYDSGDSLLDTDNGNLNAINLTEQKYCSVYSMLEKTAEMSHTVEFV